jgi:transcriptional regulator with XRE-family HTH domain
MEIDKKKFDVLLANKGLDYEKLAINAKITSRTIRRILKGIESPRIGTISKIAKALNVEVERFVKE